MLEHTSSCGFGTTAGVSEELWRSHQGAEEVQQFQLKLIDVAARILRGGALELGHVGKVSTGPQTAYFTLQLLSKK